ncbi:MAG: ABC transporter permease [Opitutaceae bacterium]|nr:ABC transporter permease [Opitutaceae bacterium]
MHADLRFALRSLLKSPGFTAVAVLSLALGIGANTTVFSLVNEVLLKSLPVREPGQLVLFSWAAPERIGPQSINGWTQRDAATGETICTSLSLHTFEQLRTSSSALLSDVFAFAPLDRVNVVLDGNAEVVTTGQIVSGNYHAALGVPMLAGRSILPTDDQPNAPPVVVISAGYWQRKFAGDPAAIGRTLAVNGVIAEIVGVTAPQFTGTLQIGEVQDLTLPLALYSRLSPDDTDATQPWCWWIRIMGRLQPGITRAQAHAGLAGVFKESIKDGLNAGEPAAGSVTPEVAKAANLDKVRFVVNPGGQGLTEARRSYTQSIQILTALVVLVLLVACANVANLLLARGAARVREITVRLALGASRARLLRQLLTESVLLAFLGAAAGLVFAWWGRAALLVLQPLGRSANMLELPLDWRVLGFTTAVAIATGILFGLAPAWRATRLDLAAGFAGGTRTLGGERSRLARILMVVQIALSLVLLVGAGLFTRTLRNLQQLDAGFNRSQLVLFSVDGVAGGHKRAELAALHTRFADRIAALPGVSAVTFSQVPVLSGSSWTSNAVVQGHVPAKGENTNVVMNGVHPGFFSAYQLPLIIGRGFTARDDAAAPKVAIVNQAFARKYFGDASPIGRRFGTGEDKNAGDWEIVGVVRDAKYTRLREEPRPAAFRPYAQLQNAWGGHFAVRVTGDAGTYASMLRGLLRDIDPNLPLANLRTQEEQIARGLSSERMFARLSSFFGLLALLLASIGLYGLLSYSVLRRTGEIGLRMALGAVPGHVLWMIVRESLLLASFGVVLGLGSAWALSRLVASRLYGLSASDPGTYAGVGLILVAVAIISSLLPARRASRVDPMVALRAE